MLFRFHDCCIYDSDLDAYSTLWIEGTSPNDAYERAVALLALVWRVPAEQVCVQSMGRSDIEILADATEDMDGGDRRLWAVGSAGTSAGGMIPLYAKQRVILAVTAKKRMRLLAAWRDAQQHAEELARLRDSEALALREKGNEREAQHREFDAGQYREFVAADLI